MMSGNSRRAACCLLPADFGFDAAERDRYLGGYIAAAFYLVGAPAALLFGWLSDRVNRKRLLFAAVVLGALLAGGRRGGCGGAGTGKEAAAAVAAWQQ